MWAKRPHIVYRGRYRQAEKKQRQIEEKTNGL